VYGHGSVAGSAASVSGRSLVAGGSGSGRGSAVFSPYATASGGVAPSPFAESASGLTPAAVPLPAQHLPAQYLPVQSSGYPQGSAVVGEGKAGLTTVAVSAATTPGAPTAGYPCQGSASSTSTASGAVPVNNAGGEVAWQWPTAGLHASDDDGAASEFPSASHGAASPAAAPTGAVALQQQGPLWQPAAPPVGVVGTNYYVPLPAAAVPLAALADAHAASSGGEPTK
jgi:hypothetical protein